MSELRRNRFYESATSFFLDDQLYGEHTAANSHALWRYRRLVQSVASACIYRCDPLTSYTVEQGWVRIDVACLLDTHLQLEGLRDEALVAGYKSGVNPVEMGRILDAIASCCYEAIIPPLDDKDLRNEQKRQEAQWAAIENLHAAVTPVNDILTCLRAEHPDIAQSIPAPRLKWEKERRILYLDGEELRRFRREATAQFPILSAFEQAGWPADGIPCPKRQMDRRTARLTPRRFAAGGNVGQRRISVFALDRRVESGCLGQTGNRV